MTIKNLFAIIIKLIGFFFIVETFITFVPEQINLLMNFDIFFPEEIKNQNIVLFPYITLVILSIVLFLIYYTFIYKTEIIIKLLRIEKYFGDIKIENITITIQKYAQISIIVVSIILLIFQLPIFINSTIKYFGVKDSFQDVLSTDLISSSIIILLSFIGIIFSDKLSRNFTK
ncbi:hypothetical protein [Empedobacter tilapiae]|uniref:Uncharacterized protein n=1 Tax=Empedobacter tilapiae TaxID=2491114 RepID=A0A4Z1C1T3_9FLAO|nr:hypothetical protein [Empedobacter tilapiae]TGN29649.1 hypothetical protein E4J94_02770 [Empedobacter tilapiae]